MPGLQHLMPGSRQVACCKLKLAHEMLSWVEAHLLCACEVDHGVERMKPVLAGGALWQAPDMQQGEAGDCLSGMEERALLKPHLSNTVSAPSCDVISSSALVPECIGTFKQCEDISDVHCGRIPEHKLRASHAILQEHGHL